MTHDLADMLERERRRHDQRCISFTDDEFSESCDCLALLMLEQNRGDRALLRARIAEAAMVRVEALADGMDARDDVSAVQDTPQGAVVIEAVPLHELRVALSTEGP